MLNYNKGDIFKSKNNKKLYIYFLCLEIKDGPRPEAIFHLYCFYSISDLKSVFMVEWSLRHELVRII